MTSVSPPFPNRLDRSLSQPAPAQARVAATQIVRASSPDTAGTMKTPARGYWSIPGPPRLQHREFSINLQSYPARAVDSVLPDSTYKGESKMRTGLIALALAASYAAALASGSPYQGEENSEIKAMNSTRVEGLLRGDGMDIARAAELDHYPGPRHALDLATELELSDSRIAQSEAIFEHMQSEAMRLGRLLVAGEQMLDRLFRQATVSAETLAGRLSELGDTRTRLRGIHLQAHLEQGQLLTEQQVNRYDLERGYLGDHGRADGHLRHE